RGGLAGPPPHRQRLRGRRHPRLHPPRRARRGRDRQGADLVRQFSTGTESASSWYRPRRPRCVGGTRGNDVQEDSMSRWGLLALGWLALFGVACAAGETASIDDDDDRTSLDPDGSVAD